MLRLAVLKPISYAVLREFIQSISLIFLLSIFILFLLYLAPGDYLLDEYILSLQSDLNDEISDIDEETIKLSFIDTYLIWLGSYLTGNFGISSSNGLPVMDQVFEYTKNTISIIVSALFISLFVALPMAFFNANKQFIFINKPIHFSLNLLSTLPLFWLCYISIYISGEWLNYFPLASDFEEITLLQFILPVLLLSLGSGVLIEMILLISNEFKRVLNEEYILYARAKGASVLSHALKEGIIFPILSLTSNRVAYLFGASIIVEQIFNWPGIGRILWRSAQDRDIALLLSAVLVSAIIIRFSYFCMRIIYIILNPRASHE